MIQGGLVDEALTRSVIGAFFEVYNDLGFGFLENTYITALESELKVRGHLVSREVAVFIRYKGAIVTMQRLDMIVDASLVVETKSTRLLPPTALRQLQNYLRATDLELGLLLHFGPEPKFYRRFLPNSQKRNPQKNKFINGPAEGQI